VRTVVTDDQGVYRIVDLRPGIYLVTFGLAGFSTARREGIELTANFTGTVNAELRVGAIAETVTVSGQSPVVDVQNVIQQNVLSRTVLDTLPSGKTIPAFAALTPGVVLPPTGQDVGGSKGEISFRMTIHGAGRAIRSSCRTGCATTRWRAAAPAAACSSIRRARRKSPSSSAAARPSTKWAAST
jgi:hypothetical protein